jgi:hypothetical protein
MAGSFRLWPGERASVKLARTMLTPSEHARHARAELDAIVAALRVHELAQLVALGRRLLGETEDCVTPREARSTR